MTIASETRRSGPYNGNGSTTVFAYGFRIVDEAHLEVVKLGTDGTETILTITTDYTVSGVGDSGGGSITMTAAPATGETITIIRKVPLTQEIDLQNQGPYLAEVIEDGLDLAVMRDQELQEQIDRAPKIPVSTDPNVLDSLIEDIIRLSDSADNIDTVAGISGDVTTVAGNAADISTVAGISGDVTKVATIDDAVAAVALIDDEVVDVAVIKTDVTTVSGVAADVSTVAGIASDVSAVAAVDGEVATVAANIAAITAANGSAMSIVDGSDTGDGVTTAFTLPASATVDQNVLVWVGGVRQKPTTDYTVSGTTITFGAAPGDGVGVDFLVIGGVSFEDVEAEADAAAASAAAAAASAADVQVGGLKTRAVLMTESIPAGVMSVETSGYATAGDGGEALYKRGASLTIGGFQSADSAYWDLAVDVVTPEMFGAAGDGVTDDTTAVTNAVAKAYADGQDLYWSAGTYLTTASIPNFHAVRHVGPGVVKRGSDLWKINPTNAETNTVYVNETSGSSTNDGLSSSEPISTIQSAADAIAIADGMAGATFRITLAADTYTEGVSLVSPQFYDKRVEIIGPTVSNSDGNSIKATISSETGTLQVAETVTGGTSGATGTISAINTSAGDLTILTIAISSGSFASGETITGGTSAATATLGPPRPKPTAILDGSGSLLTSAIIASGMPHLTIKDIEANSWTLAGIRGEFSTVFLSNIHSHSNEIGFYFTNRISYTNTGGLIHDCTKGVHELFSIVRNMKGASVTDLGSGLEIRRCDLGLFAKEHCTGHLDWTTIEDCSYGISLSRSCTANASDSVIRRNNIGVLLEHGSYLYPGRVNWGIGGADANGHNWVFAAESGFTVPGGEVTITDPQIGMTERQIGYFVDGFAGTSASHTGDTVETLLCTVGEYVSGSITLKGQYIRVVCLGRLLGGNGTVSLRLELGGSNMANITLPASNGGVFRAEFTIDAIDATTQFTSGHAEISSSGYVANSVADRSLNFNSVSTRDIEIKAQLSDASDTVEIFKANAYSNAMGLA